MKKIIISLLAVLAFSWASVVATENYLRKDSPESVVACGTWIIAYELASTLISSSPNADECTYSSPSNSCIESLETQGCKVIDSKLDHLAVKVEGERKQPWIGLPYMLSCKRP